MEGNEDQRRKVAREARARGKNASAVGGSLGASKQRREASNKMPHQERLDLRHQGKQNRGRRTEARPGSRDTTGTPEREIYPEL